MIDVSFKNNLAPKNGRILLSDPFENDAYFKRSVVYLCNHDEDGSFGFVLNNLVKINLNQINPHLPAVLISLHLGGPVEVNTLFFIHRMSDQIRNATHLDADWYLGGEYDNLLQILKNQHIQNNDIHFFLGYSGWSKGQLENEIAENAWVVSEIDTFEEVILESKSDLWKLKMEKNGSKIQMDE